MTLLKHKLLLIVLVAMSLCSCKNFQTHNDDSLNIIDSNFFGNSVLSEFSSDTKLVLDAQFNECGEWGGHNEKMVIYINDKREFNLDYKKYKVNCSSYKNGLPSQQFEKNEKINIHAKEKKSIADYIQRMIKSKLVGHNPLYHGNTFNVFLSDSSLIINVYDNKQFGTESYNRLVKELKL